MNAETTQEGLGDALAPPAGPETHPTQNSAQPPTAASLSAHVERFLYRLNRRIAGLDQEQRYAFLMNQQKLWLQRYEAFAQKVDAGLPVSPNVTCWDYLQTIQTINALLGEFHMKRYSIMVRENGVDHEVELCQVDNNPRDVAAAAQEKKLRQINSAGGYFFINKYDTVRIQDNGEQE